MLTKGTPAAELAWMEDWLTRRAAAVAAWAPSAQAGDVRVNFVDFTADIMATPSVVVGIASGGVAVAGLLVLGGIGVYRLLRRRSSRGTETEPLTKNRNVPGLFFFFK
jgi:hypothetical protein